jgi:hypothetical protein
MHTSWVRCHGCNKVFSPRGHTQHVSKTHRASCRTNGQSARRRAAPRSPVLTTAPSSSGYFPTPPNLSEERGVSENLAPHPEHGTTSPTHNTDGGEFFTPLLYSSIHTQITDDHGIVDDNDDLADQLDADVLEVLARDSNLSPSIHPDLDPSDRALSLAPPPCGSVTVNAETSRSTRTDVIVDHFPFGNPGAPVPGMQRSSSVYEATRESLGDSQWAPFRSQCDWEFARWAKMRGPTSTAVTELLAIPEVCTYWLSQIALLTRL